MDDMESKLGAILGNPQMMQQIMTMAQALGQSPPPQTAPPPQSEQPKPQPSFPAGMDPAMLQRVAALARQSGIDRDQQQLLKALTPYLNRERISKLEKAMRAAKIAAAASTALRSSGVTIFPGR